IEASSGPLISGPAIPCIDDIPVSIIAEHGMHASAAQSDTGSAKTRIVGGSGGPRRGDGPERRRT
ncbi:hypothetical protein ADL26_19515, partial [Thermoactinomyces vulgaris]